MRCKLCMVVLMGALCFPVSGCRKKRPEAPNLMDPTVKLSYAFGHDMGEQLRHRKDRIDFRAFMQGVEDAYMGRPPAIPAAEMERLKAEALRRAEEQRARYLKQIAEKNLQESRKFLEENARREGVRTTASGLQYVVLKEGDGPRPTDGDRVRIHYRGTLVDGTEFDSSYGRPEPVTCGLGEVIPGLAEAIKLMRTGSKYRVFVPPELAYGAAGKPPVVGPNAALIFEVELLGIEKPGAEAGQ